MPGKTKRASSTNFQRRIIKYSVAQKGQYVAFFPQIQSIPVSLPQQNDAVYRSSNVHSPDIPPAISGFPYFSEIRPGIEEPGYPDKRREDRLYGDDYEYKAAQERREPVFLEKVNEKSNT